MELFFRLHTLLYRVLRENSSPSMEVTRSRQYTETRGHPTHTLTSGLSPFPKKTNCHVDHDHYYYDLNQKPNRHFTTSLTPLNCPTDPSSVLQITGGTVPSARDYGVILVVSEIGSRVENRRSGFSLPVAVGVLSHDPPQSGLA